MKTDGKPKTVVLSESEYSDYCDQVLEKRWREIVSKHYVLNTENYKSMFQHGFSCGIKAGFELLRQIESGENSIKDTP